SAAVVIVPPAPVTMVIGADRELDCSATLFSESVPASAPTAPPVMEALESASVPPLASMAPPLIAVVAKLGLPPSMARVPATAEIVPLLVNEAEARLKALVPEDCN